MDIIQKMRQNSLKTLQEAYLKKAHNKNNPVVIIDEISLMDDKTLSRVENILAKQKVTT